MKITIVSHVFNIYFEHLVGIIFVFLSEYIINMDTLNQNTSGNNTSNLNTPDQNTVPVVEGEVVTDGQIPQIEITKKALTMLFLPASKPLKEDFQTLIKELNPGYDTSKKTIHQLKSDILEILNERSVFSILDRTLIRDITPLNLGNCETTKDNKGFEDIKTNVNNFFSSDKQSNEQPINPLNNENQEDIQRKINETMTLVSDRMEVSNVAALGKLVSTYPVSFRKMVGIGEENLIYDNNNNLKKICHNNKNFWFAIIQYFLHLAATSLLNYAIPVDSLKAITENDTNVDQTERDELFDSVSTETKLDTRQFLAVERFSNPKVNELDRGSFLFHGVGTGKTITSLALALTCLETNEVEAEAEVRAAPSISEKAVGEVLPVGVPVGEALPVGEAEIPAGVVESVLGTKQNPLKILIVGPSGLFLSAFKNDTAVLNIYTYNSQSNTINPPHDENKNILIESFQGQIKKDKDNISYINFIGLDYNNLIKNNGFEGIREILGAHVVIFDEAHKLITESLGPMEYFNNNENEIIENIQKAAEALIELEKGESISQTDDTENQTNRLNKFTENAKNIDKAKQFYFKRNDLYYEHIFNGHSNHQLTQFKSYRNLGLLDVEIEVENDENLNVLKLMKHEDNLSKIHRNTLDAFINRTKFVLPDENSSTNQINIISDHRFFEFCCMKYQTDNQEGDPPKKIIFLTGTPIQNKTSNLTDIIYFLNNPLLNKSNFSRYNDMLSYFDYGDHCFIPWENGQYTADKIGGKLDQPESSFVERTTKIVQNLDPTNGIRWVRTIGPYLRAPGANTGVQMERNRNLFSIIGKSAELLHLDTLASSIYENGGVGVGLGAAGAGILGSIFYRDSTKEKKGGQPTQRQKHSSGTTAQVEHVDKENTTEAVTLALQDGDGIPPDQRRLIFNGKNKSTRIPEYANNPSGKMDKLLDKAEKTPPKDIENLYKNYVITDFKKLTILEKLTVVEDVVKRIIEKSAKDFTFENNEELTKNYYNGCLNMILVPMIFYSNPQEYTKNIVDKYINGYINNILAGTNIKKENWQAHNDYIVGNLTATVFYCRYTIENNEKLVKNSTDVFKIEKSAYTTKQAGIAAEKRAKQQGGEDNSSVVTDETIRQKNEGEIRNNIHNIILTLINTGVGTSLVFGIGILEPLIQVLSKIISMGPDVFLKMMNLTKDLLIFFIDHYKSLATVGTEGNISILQIILTKLEYILNNVTLQSPSSMGLLGGFVVIIAPIIMDICSDGKTDIHAKVKFSVIFANYIMDYIGKDYMAVIELAKKEIHKRFVNNTYSTLFNFVTSELKISPHVVSGVIQPVAYIYIASGAFLNLTYFSNNIINPPNVKLSLMPYVSIYNYDYQKYAIDDNIERNQSDDRSLGVNTGGNKNRFPRKYIEEILCVPTDDQVKKLIELDNMTGTKPELARTEDPKQDEQGEQEGTEKAVIFVKKTLDYDNIYCNTDYYLNKDDAKNLITLSDENLTNNIKLKERLKNEKKPLRQEQDEFLESKLEKNLYICPTTYNEKNYGIYNIPNNFQYKLLNTSDADVPKDLEKLFESVKNNIEKLPKENDEEDTKNNRFEHVYTLMKINRCGAVFVNNNLTIQPHYINKITSDEQTTLTGKIETRKEEVDSIVKEKPNFRYYLPVFYPTTIEIMCAFCNFLKNSKTENYILMSSTLKPVDMELHQDIGASLTFPISHEKTHDEGEKYNPICIIISPEHKEGFSFTYSPCIYLPGLPNSTGDQEQIYGRILRKYKRTNNTCQTETNVCKYDKQIYQYFAGNRFDKDNLNQFSTIYGTHSKRHIYTTQTNLDKRLNDQLVVADQIQQLDPLSHTNDSDNTSGIREQIFKNLLRPTTSAVGEVTERDLKTYIPKSFFDKWYNTTLIPRQVDNVALVNTDTLDDISDYDKYGYYKYISDENKLSQIKQVRNIQDNIFELLSEVENKTYKEGHKTILPFDCNINIIYGLDKQAILDGNVYNENKTNIKYEVCEMSTTNSDKEDNKLYINCVPRKKQVANISNSKKYTSTITREQQDAAFKDATAALNIEASAIENQEKFKVEMAKKKAEMAKKNAAKAEKAYQEERQRDTTFSGGLQKSRKRRNAKHKKTQKARKKQTIQLRNKYKQLKKGHRTLKRKQ